MENLIQTQTQIKPDSSNLILGIPPKPTGPTKRLIIHKMVLINFKSYAGRQEIGPFHKVSMQTCPSLSVIL